MRHDISEAKRQRHRAEIAEQGYTIVPDAIEVELVDALNIALFDLERRDQIVPGHNAFEGHHTIRIYNLLARGATFAEVPVHRNVLPMSKACSTTAVSCHRSRSTRARRRSRCTPTIR